MILSDYGMARVKEIIEKYFSSTSDKKTIELFADWLSSSVDSDLKDQVLQDQWEKEYYLSPEAVSQSYAQVMRKIRRNTSNRSRRVWIYSAAASVVMALIFSVILSYIGQQEQVVIPAAAMTQCYAANGEKQVVTLPDSSIVILNSGSLLIYPEEFNAQDRQVYLTGEAIFDVAKDEQHPFKVKTPDFTVKVHGTLFNVSSYMEGRYSSATLKEGSISIAAKGGEQYLLSPNQTFRYEKDTHKVSVVQAEVDEAFAWKDGKLCFKSESIHTIVKTIERYYGIPVYLTTGKYDNELLTAKFIHGETIEEMLSALCLIVPGMHYRIENSIVYIQ